MGAEPDQRPPSSPSDAGLIQRVGRSRWRHNLLTYITVALFAGFVGGEIEHYSPHPYDGQNTTINVYGSASPRLPFDSAPRPNRSGDSEKLRHQLEDLKEQLHKNEVATEEALKMTAELLAEENARPTPKPTASSLSTTAP